MGFLLPSVDYRRQRARPESVTYRGIRPPIRARLRRQAHLCGAHVVSNYAPLLDARLPCIQTRLDALGSHARRRIQARMASLRAWFGLLGGVLTAAPPGVPVEVFCPKR